VYTYEAPQAQTKLESARPAKISVNAEKVAGPSTAFAEADHYTYPADEFIAAVEEEKAAGPSAAPAGADRRTHPRYEFVAAVEVIAAESGARMETRVRDLSQQKAAMWTRATPLLWRR